MHSRLTWFQICFLPLLCVLVLCGSAFGLDRSAFTFTNYDLRVRVVPATHGFEGNGKIALRNDSTVPQRNLSLQISSSLSWKTIRLGDKQLTYVTQPYETDIDHTGAVSEAIVELPEAVAPNQTVILDVSYGGTITADATRLTRIGVPEAVAFRNDWDSISTEFTALRGAGYVCWYPVAMESASLSEGNRYFEVLGEWKQRESEAVMTVAIQEQGSDSILANGRLTGSSAHAPINPEEATTRESDYSFRLGRYPATFAIASYSTVTRPTISVEYVGEDRASAEEFVLAAEKVLPLITRWFGPEREKVQVIELADADAMPFDSGAIVFTPLRSGDQPRTEVQVAHQLAHACEPVGTSRAWISEGLAQFAQALVREQQAGRGAALNWMDGLLPALQAAENQALQGSAGQTSSTTVGQPLTRASDPAYYNIKAMFVWWMLRDMVGDDALQHVIQSYQPAQDKEPSYVQRLAEVQSKKSLEWFFADWVYRDRGLPDFRIKAGFVRTMLAGNISVTLTVENLGDASAEVPVIIKTERGEIPTRMLVKGKSEAVKRVEVPLAPVSAVVNDGSVPESDMTNDTYTFPAKSNSQ